MDYTITAEKLEELNVVINRGGQIPTAVNKATGRTAEFLGVGDVPSATASNLNASRINDTSGAAWRMVQAWHDSVKSGETVEPPEPPPEEPEPLPPDQIVYVDSIRANGVNSEIKDMRPQAMYCYQLEGDKPGTQVSFSRPGGFQCHIAYGATAGSKQNVGQSGMGTAILLGVSVPVGSWVTMWLDAGSTPSDDALYSA